MADKTISGLTALPGTLDPAAILAIVQSGVTYKATGQQVLDMVAANLATAALPVETWTPTILGSSSNPTLTYTSQVGFYVRIGNLVHVSARIAWSALSGGGGNARVSLPIAGAGNGDFSETLPVLLAGIEFPTGVTSAVLRVRPGGAASADLFGSGSGINSTAFGLTHLVGSGSIIFSGLYRV